MQTTEYFKNIDSSNVQEEKEEAYGKYANYNENCIKFEGWKGPLYDKTQLNEDKCYTLETTKQSTFPGQYTLSNYNTCDCKMSDVVKFATENPYMKFKDGYGVSECNINDSSKLRVGKTRKNPKCKNQLFHRPYLTVPYMGNGSGNAQIETQLVPGEDTTQKKQCNSLSGITIDNFFIPLVKNLKDNIQNPNYLIQENADSKWIRGGIPSRQIVKDIDYIERCGKRL